MHGRMERVIADKLSELQTVLANVDVIVTLTVSQRIKLVYIKVLKQTNL